MTTNMGPPAGLHARSFSTADFAALPYTSERSSARTNKSRLRRSIASMNKITSRFNRRKSSGNVLETGEPSPPAESSFRVLERPQPAHENNSYLKRPPQLRPRTSPHNSERRPYSYFGDGSDSTSNRGSGNTNNSNATTLDSNKRFSYASTEPSSIDDSLEEQGDLPFQPRQKYTPIPRTNTDPPQSEPHSRKPFSLKAAGRAFSFGAKSAKNIPPPQSQDVPPMPNRDRSMTSSSYASTAVPPQLDLGGGTTGLGLGQSEFGDIFGKRKSTIMEESAGAQPSPTRSQPLNPPPSRGTPSPQPPPIPSTYLSYQAQNPPPRDDLHYSSQPPYMLGPGAKQHRPYPVNTQAYPPREVPPRKTGSPYSWRSNASEERLMSSPKGAYRDSPDLRSAPFTNNEADHSVVLDALNASQYLENEHSPQPPRHIPESAPMPRTRGARPPPSAYRGPEPPRRSPLSDMGPRTPNANILNDRADGFSDVDLTPQARNVSAGDDEPLFDAPRARRFVIGGTRSKTTPAPSNNKVMTPAEFENYKKHKENAPPEEDDKSESSSDSETYEDDDETERQKEAAKQRRKQEAHLAVYRQQMMKVTGEQPSELPSQQPPRAPLERSSVSAPSLLGNLSFDNPANRIASKGSAEDDEEDEVPLGVLQAHGFPNRNRPPTRLSSSTDVLPRPESQIASYPAPGGTTRNDAAAGGGGNVNLPIFAKHLPQDPYVGASLVNQPARESLAFSQSSNAPHPPQPPQGAGGNLPPGGLVGVIATEERAKAMRRGSPNARGLYDPVPSQQLPHEAQQQRMMQQMMQQQMPPQHQMMQQQMPSSPMPGQISAGEQSQLQMANQMTQMMQMQMQFMQWAMQNNGQMPNGMQMPPGMQMPMGMPSPNTMQSPQIPQPNFGAPSFLGTDPMARPQSTMSGNFMGGHQRASSNLSRVPRSNHMAPSTNGMLSSSQSVYGMQAPGGGYTPSIAPSERSVVGQPSRYRPVTPGGNQNRERESRTSSMSNTTVQALRGQRSKSRLRNETTNDSLKPTIKAVERPKHGGRGSHDDEDDDEGWAEMQKQRQARKSRWHKSKPQPTVPGSQEGGLEGLLYEGPQA